jgi:hypothetical protein
MEYAWVIEVAHVATPLYWDGADWSGNHMRAVRFSRKVDADRIMVNIPSDMRRADMRTAEHGWGGTPRRAVSYGDDKGS